ncbi:MAG: starch-binding protein [Ruminococcus sp.]|nr:starch-binding protein [Ruminococcus sp.]
MKKEKAGKLCNKILSIVLTMIIAMGVVPAGVLATGNQTTVSASSKKDAEKVSVGAPSSKALNVVSKDLTPEVSVDGESLELKKEGSGEGSYYSCEVGDADKCTLSVKNFELNENEDVYFFKNDANWEKVYAYFWKDSDDNGKFPGTEMTPLSDDVYYIIVESNKYENIVFSAGEGKEQTVDIAIADDDYFSLGELEEEKYLVNRSAADLSKLQYSSVKEISLSGALTVAEYKNNDWVTESITEPVASITIGSGDSYYIGESYTVSAKTDKDYNASLKLDGAPFDDDKWIATVGSHTFVLTSTHKSYGWISFEKTLTVSVGYNWSLEGSWKVIAGSKELSFNENTNAYDVLVDKSNVDVKLEYVVNSVTYNGTDVKDNISITYYSNEVDIDENSGKFTAEDAVNAYITATVEYNNNTTEIYTDVSVTKCNLGVNAEVADNNKIVHHNDDYYTNTYDVSVVLNNSDEVENLKYALNGGEEKAVNIESGKIVLNEDDFDREGKVSVSITGEQLGFSVERSLTIYYRDRAEEPINITFGNKTEDGQDWKQEVEVSFEIENAFLLNDDSVKVEGLENRLTLDKFGDTYKYSFIAKEETDYSVTCTDKLGNSFVIGEEKSDKYKISVDSLMIDTSAPTINSVEILPAPESDKLASFLTFGIYDQTGVRLILDITDSKSGFESVTIKGAKEEITSSDADAEFTLGESDKPYEVSFEVVDKIGNKKEYKLTDLNIKASEEYLEVIKNISKATFEIVVSKAGSKCEKFDIESEQKNEENNVYKDISNISATITDELSGIKTINAYFGKEDGFDKNESTKAKVSVDKSDFTNNKTTEINVDFAPGKLETGEYEYLVEVESNNGVVKEHILTFFVDADAPVIDKVTFDFEKPEQTAGEKFMQFITFGLFSNDNISVTVEATDNSPSGGIKNNSISIGEKNKDVSIISTKKKDNTIVTKFKIPKSDKLYDVEKLKINVIDAFGNDSTSSISSLDKDKVVFENLDKSDFEKIKDLSSFKYIVVSDKKPKTPQLSVSRYKSVEYSKDGKDYYSGDVEAQVNCQDELSGLMEIVTKLDNEKVDKLSETDVSRNSKEFVGKKEEYQKISELVNLDSGEHKLTATATNNVNATSEVASATFYIDKDAPKVVDFSFEPKNPLSEKSEKQKPVKEENYGYYFNQDVTITVYAEDGDERYNSGLGDENSTIKVRCVDISGKETKHTIKPVDGKGSFTVNKNFKGQIYATASDNVGNRSKEVHPKGTIVETSKKHDDSSAITIDMPKTNYRDINGKKLYSKDILVPITVEDTYSGIKNVTYSIESEFDQANNVKDRSIRLETLKKDKNLRTLVTGDIPVNCNSNDITLTVTMIDNAGNTSTAKRVFSIDKTAPKVTVTYNHNVKAPYKYINRKVTATVTVTERNFDSKKFEYYVNADGAPNPSLSNWSKAKGSGDNTTHTATLTFLADADYKFAIKSISDLAHHSATKLPSDKFTVDMTNPKISVSFDENGKVYYGVNRTATITIKEHNFNSSLVDIAINATGADNTSPATAPAVSSWSDNGDTHTATITFANDGMYSFTVNSKDKADNNAEKATVSKFYIDHKKPVIKISGVEAEKAYGENSIVSPTVEIADPNYDSSAKEITLNRIDIKGNSVNVADSLDYAMSDNNEHSTGIKRVYENFKNAVDYDGIYELSVKETDKAGNSNSDSIIFSVNRFGSTYMLDKQTETTLKNGFLKNAKDVVISEINVNKLEEYSVTISKNSEKVKTLKKNYDYNVKIVNDRNKWYRYIYTISSSNFEEDGSYTVTLISKDMASNATSNRTSKKQSCPVSFIVDNTMPDITISGIESGVLYGEDSRKVNILCEDANIDKETLEIELDGVKLNKDVDYTLEDESNSFIAKLVVNANQDVSAQNLVVKVADYAGNNKEIKVENFVLSASLFMRFFHNIPLVVGTFAGLFILIGAVIFVVLKKRKN